MIRPVLSSDAQSVCDIYNEYVKNSTVTFEEISVQIEEMAMRIKATIQNYPWLVYEIDNRVVGYAYARRWKERSAYLHTVETGTYLDGEFVSRGIGSELKKELLEALRERSVHAVISGIALPNAASVALNEKFGFTKVAHFKEVGYKFNKWIDVGYWQLIL
jgi:L-amino acid N-acyltransferase YncA